MDGAAFFNIGVVLEQAVVLSSVHIAVGVLHIDAGAVRLFGEPKGVLGDVVTSRSARGVGHVDFVLQGVLVVLVAGADDADEVVDAWQEDAVARQQDVIVGRIGSSHRLEQVNHHVGGALALELGIANVGVAGGSASAAQEVGELLVARHDGVVAGVLHLAADVDHLLKLVLGDFAHNDLVVGLQGKLEGLAVGRQVAAEFARHLSEEGRGAHLAVGALLEFAEGVKTAHLDARVVGIGQKSARKAQGVAQGHALGKGGVDSGAHGPVDGDVEALVVVGLGHDRDLVFV